MNSSAFTSQHCLPNCEANRRLLLDRVLAELSGNQLPHFARVSETRGFTEATTGYILELKDAGAELRQLLKSYPAGVDDETRHDQATRIFEQYERRLARCHRFDPSDRLRRAASLWEQSRIQPFEMVRSVFVAGFTSITKPQQRLMEAVRNSVEHFWIERPDEENDVSGGPRSGIARLTDAFDRFVPTETIAAPSSQSVPAHLIEAAGDLGEARQIARHIRGGLARGIRPDRVLVVARRFSPASIELFQEVFDEFEIPHEAEGSESLDRAAAVAFLLRAWRVPQEGWEFSQVASILRSTFFRPDWPEVKDDPEIPAKAEALLRMLGETRGHDAFLRAVATWEQLPPEPLEDERPEEPLRLRKHRLARQCRPFLERFFRTWDSPGSEVTAADAVARLKSFADEIGVSRAEAKHRSDLNRFWIELDRWLLGETSISKRKLIRPNRFARVLSTLAAAPCRARTDRGSGVALLSAENAVGLVCDCLCLVGLGEGSWPEMAAPISLLDEAERQRLRIKGLALPNSEERLEREQFLFSTLLAAPRRELVLSYAGVNDKGQKLLPCSFLREYLGKTPASTASRQNMLLDGYFTQDPMSGAELRTQAVYRMNLASPLPPKIIDNLARARTVALARFESSTYSAFDGELRHPATAIELARRVGRDRVFSPTALERYVACPFRFLLQHVLGLQPLEDPSEEVEYTRRGSAFHRALARFHERLNAKDSEPIERGDRPDSVTGELVLQIERAVGEYAARAPSRASAELWRLEGKRLERARAALSQTLGRLPGPVAQAKGNPRPVSLRGQFRRGYR